MNQHTITGAIGKDPELKKTQSGKSVINFNVAVTDGYGDKKQTTWFTCVAWEKKAEFIAAHLGKGNRVIVTGRGTIRDWEKDGVKHKQYEIVVDEIEPITWKDGDKPKEKQAEQPTLPAESFSEDIPF